MKKYVAVLGLMLAECHMAAADVRGVVVDENDEPVSMGGKTKRAMLSERSEVGSRDVSVSYGAMS